MSDPFLDLAYARLAAQLGLRAQLDGQSAAGQPCKQGQSAARTGCIPVDKQGNQVGESSRTKAAADVHRRAAAREMIQNMGKRSGGVSGPFERARQVAHVSEHTGVDKATASALIDRHEGVKTEGSAKQSGGLLPTGEQVAAFARSVGRMLPAELEHWDHELAKSGVNSRVARGALIAGYLAAKTAMAATGTHGPVGIVAHHVGELANAAAYWSGADAMTTVNLIHTATKISVKALKAGVNLLRGGKA